MSRGRIVRGDAWAAHLQDLLARSPWDVGDWMTRHTRLLKRDRDSQVGLLLLQQKLCCLKFYAFKSRLQRWRYHWGSGRAIHAFDIGRQLVAAGLAGPRPLACLRIDAGMLLLSEGIPDANNLQSLWLSRAEGTFPAHLLTGAGTVLARWHMAGYAHGDCKWSNVLCAGGQVVLIDLDAARAAPLGAPRQARDLARFTLNAEEMGMDADAYAQFLDSYCGVVGTDRQETQRRMLPALEKLRARHLARYGKHGHPLVPRVPQ